MKKIRIPAVVGIAVIAFAAQGAIAQSAKPGAEWDKTIELAKKEGKVVVSIPASTELRAAIEKSFEKRYGIDVEPVVAGHRRSCARWSTKARPVFAMSICTWAAASRS